MSPRSISLPLTSSSSTSTPRPKRSWDVWRAVGVLGALLVGCLALSGLSVMKTRAREQRMMYETMAGRGPGGGDARTLVMYVYYEADAVARENLEFFLKVRGWWISMCLCSWLWPMVSSRVCRSLIFSAGGTLRRPDAMSMCI
jgi:hypothetical protein